MDTFRFTYKKMEEIVQVWGEIANERRGKFRNILCTSPAMIDPINSKLKRFELQLPGLQNSKIIIKTSEKQPLKVEYTFKTKLTTDFQIYPEYFIEKITKFLGAKELEIDDKHFDNKFIIKSNNKTAMLSILTNEIKEYLLKNQISSISLIPDNYSKLHIVLLIRENDKEEMNNLIDFTVRLIDLISNWEKKTKYRTNTNKT